MEDPGTFLLLKTALLLFWMSKTPRDNALWVAFVDRLTPRIYDWCRRRILQDADAKDLTQKLLFKIWNTLKKGKYNPGQGSARGWILRILDNQRKDDYREQSRRRQFDAENATPERAEAVNELKQWIDDEHKLWVMTRAMVRVRKWVAAQKSADAKMKWKVFRAAVLEESVSLDEVAARFGMSKQDVSRIKHRMLKRIHAEVERIEREVATPQGERR